MMRIALALFLLNFAAPVWAATPFLEVKGSEGTHRFSRAELLRLPGLRKITVKEDPSYPGAARSYEAVPARELFRNVKLDPAGSLLFHCEDGFSAPLSIPLLLGQDSSKAEAFLAIEDPRHPWPALGKGKASAGPFYLIWLRPELSQVGSEQWPFQLKGFSWQESAAKKYPHTSPDPALAADSPEQKGYAVFQKDCFSCHRINGEGEATKMGPDLNLPFSPVEYFAPGFLEKLVRNPQSLRRWPESRMPGFDAQKLSAEEFRELEAYFRHMASRKVAGS